MKETSITIDVTLDENHVPYKLHWSAPDGGISNQETHAVFEHLEQGNAGNRSN